MSILVGTTIDQSVEDGASKSNVDDTLRSHSAKKDLLAGSWQEGPMQLYKTVRAARLYEQIVEQIERSIVEEKLKPGDQLPTERELAQQFGVSRTAVREAVKTLTEKGLVESHSGRGTFVQASLAQNARISLEAFLKHGNHHDPAHLVELREIIEPEVTVLAATRIEEQQLAMMRDAVALMDSNMRNPEAYIEADLDFHLALAEAAGNPLILSLLDSVVGMLREQRMGIFRVNGGPERGQIHHKHILEAIERRDAVAARLAMHEHLKQIRQDSAELTASRASSEAASRVQLI
jgi:GntR family transcriptional regulator, transcriptional repressor for pyruvate dehydrogenase complex